jgi:hypothetical protein
MDNIKIESALNLLKEAAQLLGVKEENISTVIEDIKENLLKETKVCVGDVVMKDFSIVKTKDAKDRLNEVFGVVFYANGSDVRFMALEKSEYSLRFKTENTLVSKHLPLYENERNAKKDMNGKMNSEIIKNAPDFSKEKYPSMGYCMDYNRFGFDKGMWYLPSIGELELIYDSKAELNKTLKMLGKEEICNGWQVSSSDCCAEWSWWFLMYVSFVDGFSKHSDGWVRPCFSITI